LCEIYRIKWSLSSSKIDFLTGAENPAYTVEAVPDLVAVVLLGKNGAEDPAAEAVPYLEDVVLLGKNGAEDPAAEAVPYLEDVVLLWKNSAEDLALEAVPDLELGGCGTVREKRCRRSCWIGCTISGGCGTAREE
jgi:hypothetical protein